MDAKEKEKRLSYARNQFEISKMRVLYWQSMAVTGACKLRDTEQGREATEEEKANDYTIGWRKYTDEDKVNNALETMNRHIQRMEDLNDALDALLEEE